jgi:hypothetical protein
MIGTKLAHYEITSHIGSGGMGDVYQATEHETLLKSRINLALTVARILPSTVLKVSASAMA